MRAYLVAVLWLREWRDYLFNPRACPAVCPGLACVWMLLFWPCYSVFTCWCELVCSQIQWLHQIHRPSSVQQSHLLPILSFCSCDLPHPQPLPLTFPPFAFLYCILPPPSFRLLPSSPGCATSLYSLERLPLSSLCHPSILSCHPSYTSFPLMCSY